MNLPQITNQIGDVLEPQKESTFTTFRVTYDGFHGYFAPDGYSKYNERFNAHHKEWDKTGAFPEEPIYGLEQALEHIEELKEHVYDGKKIHKDRVLYIEVVTTTTQTYIPEQEMKISN